MSYNKQMSIVLDLQKIGVERNMSFNNPLMSTSSAFACWPNTVASTISIAVC